MHGRAVTDQKATNVSDVGVVLEGSLIESDLFTQVCDVLFVVEREEIVLKEGICDMGNLAESEWRRKDMLTAFKLISNKRVCNAPCSSLFSRTSNNNDVVSFTMLRSIRASTTALISIKGPPGFLINMRANPAALAGLRLRTETKRAIQLGV